MNKTLGKESEDICSTWYIINSSSEGSLKKHLVNSPLII